MDLFYQWVWIYAAPVKFTFVLQMLPPYPTVFGIYSFLNETFAGIAIKREI